MSIKIQAALEELNRATERTYTIQQEGEQYTLLMPLGGAYNPVDAYTMTVRLVTLTIAAKGRVR